METKVMETQSGVLDNMRVLKKMYMQLLKVSNTGLELFEKDLSDEEFTKELRIITKKWKSLMLKIIKTADRVKEMESKLREEKVLDSSWPNNGGKYEEYLETKGEIIELIKVIQVNNSKVEEGLEKVKMQIDGKIGENRKIKTAVNCYQPMPVFYNASFFDKKR